MAFVVPPGPITFSANGKPFWQSHDGPQTDALKCDAFEILYGGARGGGKSAALIAWLALGNFSLPTNHPYYVSYLKHPKYRALVLRRDATDLKEFVSEASAFFRPMGLIDGKAKDEPPIFKFASGAMIYTNHLKNEDAFEKYKGWGLIKVGIEELTLIESETSYLKVIGSMRSPYPEMRTQIFCTTNPDGNGSPWVRKRFVYVKGAHGKMIPWGTKMRDAVISKATGVEMTRIFIPAKLKDNPSLGADYRAKLMMQDPKTRRAWLDGDWDALTGSYFSEFRANGPLEGEPECARHVIRPVPLMSWWPRCIGSDWGYHDNAANVWLCDNQDDGRLHGYRELIRNHTGSERIGVEVARESIPDLIDQPDLQIPLYLSHDAFQKRDVTKTTAELMQKGMEAVLGAGSALIASGSVSVSSQDGEPMDIAQEYDASARIIIHKAGNERVGVWQHIRALLRFEPMIDLGQPNLEYVRKLLEYPDGMVRYEAYLRSFEKAKEVLPGIQIWDTCPQLIEEMQTAIHDDKKPEDILDRRDGPSHMDALQALRHVIMMLQRRKNAVPFKQFMAQKMGMASQYATDPNVMGQVYRKAASDYDKQHSTGDSFRLPRASSRQRVM